VEKCGEIRFVFGDDPFMHVHIFTADRYTGTPEETAEARPEWFHMEDLPFDEMSFQNHAFRFHLLGNLSYSIRL
jgi:hypothetical protein